MKKFVANYKNIKKCYYTDAIGAGGECQSQAQVSDND